MSLASAILQFIILASFDPPSQVVRGHFQRLRVGLRIFLQKLQSKEHRRLSTSGRVAAGGGAGVGSGSGGGGYHGSPLWTGGTGTDDEEEDDEEDEEEGANNDNSYALAYGGRFSREWREERRRAKQLAALRRLLAANGALRQRPAAYSASSAADPLSTADVGGLLLNQMQVLSCWMMGYAFSSIRQTTRVHTCTLSHLAGHDQL